MWTDEQFSQYRKENSAFETMVENILGDNSLRSCAQCVCSNLRNNFYRFRIVLADATDFKIEDEYGNAFCVRRSGTILTLSVEHGCTNIYSKTISLRKWNCYRDLGNLVDTVEHVFRSVSDTYRLKAEADMIVNRVEGQG